MKNNHKKSVADLFSSTSTYWTDIYDSKKTGIDPFDHYTVANRKQRVFQFLARHLQGNIGNVLDIGCGSGELLGEIAQRGNSVTGLDLSFTMLCEAREKLLKKAVNNFHVVQGDIENLPFKEKTFEAVACVGVLQYLIKDDFAVHEICRVANDRGCIIYTLPNLFRIASFLDPYYIFKRGFDFIRFLISKRLHNNSYTLTSEEFSKNSHFRNRRYVWGQLDRLFKNHGFHRKKTIGIGFGPLTFWRHRLVPFKWAFFFSGLFEKLATFPYFHFISIFATRWVVYLTKKQ